MFTVRSTLDEQFLQVQQIGFVNRDPYAMRRGGCLELYYCNMVEWFWQDSSLISTTNCFLQCFDTVGLVTWPVKIVSKMTYNVSSGTLSLYTTTTTTTTTTAHQALKCQVDTSVGHRP